MRFADKYNAQKKFKKLQKRSKRRIHPGVAILLAVIILNAGYFAWWYYSHTTNGSSSKEAPGAEIAVTISGTSYHYSQLTEKQQYVYQQLFRACENYEPAVMIYYTSEKDCKRAYEAFRRDHPEFFWVKDTVYWSSGRNVEKITFSVPKDVIDQKAAVETVAKALLKKSPDGEYVYLERLKSRDTQVDSFDAQVKDKTTYVAMVEKFEEIVNKCLLTNDLHSAEKKLVGRILWLICEDQSILDDNKFYINPDGSPVSKSMIKGMIESGRPFVVESFLLGVWHFALAYRTHNDGKGTYQKWCMSYDEEENYVKTGFDESKVGQRECVVCRLNEETPEILSVHLLSLSTRPGHVKRN